MFEILMGIECGKNLYRADMFKFFVFDYMLDTARNDNIQRTYTICSNWINVSPEYADRSTIEC